MESTIRVAPARPAPAEPSTPRLVHEPALDGLRGLAVAAVVVFHLDHLRGGFLGVDLFFVLSGYLITSLLLVEHGSRRAIDLGAFWVRRARRLLPALLLMLAGVAALVATLTPASDRPRVRAELLATLGYVANWQRMAADVTYWQIFSQPSPLDHTWSLAIEEQFYVVWPLVVLAVLAAGARRWGVTRLGLVSLAGATLSFALLATRYSPLDTNRAYFGTDTRLGPTLLGAALAAWAVRRRRDGPPAPALQVAGAAALAWIVWSLAVVDGQGGWYYRGGLATFALAALVVIAATTGGPPGWLGRLVALRPLAGLGRISYGVYLWHWPVIVHVRPPRVDVPGPALVGLRLALTLGLALASYHLVERPVRRGALQGRRAALAALSAVAVVAVAGTVATRGPAGAGEAAAPLAAGEGRPYWIFPESDDIPDRATRLLLVGDSGPIFLGPELVEAAAGGDDVAVAMRSELRCTPVVVGGRMRYPDGSVEDRPECHGERHEAWREALDRFRPDVVVYYLASAGGLGRGLIDGEWVSDCDPPFDRHLEEVLAGDVTLLASRGATVVFATSPYVNVISEGSDDRVDCRNATYRRLAARLPGTGILDLHAFLEAQRAATGESLLRDFVHLDARGAELVAGWLVAEIHRFA